MTETEDEKKVTKKTTPKLVVKTISVKGKAALVEGTVDKRKVRKLVPNHQVVDGKVTKAVFEAGMPYGINWAEYPIQSITADALYNELINNDIWTYEDARNNPVEVQFAIIRLANLIRVDLMEFARNKKT